MHEHKDGFVFPYTVKEIPSKGLGVFTNDPIKNGFIVWRHMPGQYAVYDEKSFKALISTMTRDETVYELTHAFGLSDFPNCIIRVFDPGVLFNHSNNHNLITNNSSEIEKPLDEASPDYIENVIKALLDDRYAMIATRDIAAGEELTNNYALEIGDPPFFEAIYDQYDIDNSYLING